MKALTRNLVVIFLSTLLLTAVVSAQEIAVIETKFGKIEIQFFEDKAPGHVKNFKDLAKKGFYDEKLHLKDKVIVECNLVLVY